MYRAAADTPTLAALGLLLGGLSRRTLTLQTLAGASPSLSAAPRDSCDMTLTRALTDDPDLLAALRQLVDAHFP